MSKTFFCDFETLGVRPNSIALSFGIVAVDPEEDLSFDELVSNGIELKFDIKEQAQSLNRVTDEGAIEFWKKQGAAAKRVLAAKSTDISLTEFPSLLKDYLDDNGWSNKGSDRLLVRGPDFDYSLMKNIFWQCGLSDEEFPVRHWCVRDVRTAIEYMSDGVFADGKVPIDTPDGFIYHNALHDAVFDAMQMMNLHRVLGENNG